MFEFGRELKRFFQADGPKDGLTGGDAGLLELLDLDLLRAEARSADIAAGRISARDRPQRQLEAAVIWREIARRTGDAAALRKAASAAELAAVGFDCEARAEGRARARCEQAFCALLGAELFGDEGLEAAADLALADAAASAGGNAAMVGAGRALVQARAALRSGDSARIAAAAAAFDEPVAALDTLARRRPSNRLRAAGARADRAELQAAEGARRGEPAPLRAAIAGLEVALTNLDPAYEPLSWARLTTLRGAARAALAQVTIEVGEIAGAVNDLVGVLEYVSRAHSPLDWARAQLALAGALQMLGEATDSDLAFDQAAACHDRALTVIGDQPALLDRANVAYDRAVCLARRAELRGDLAELDQAEAALRAELRAANAAADPVGWAVRQLNFARLYEARASIVGRDAAGRGAATVALTAAVDVFGEYGHRTLADIAQRGLSRLQMAAPHA